MALADCVHLRHGDLPDAFCGVSHAAFSMVLDQSSRVDGCDDSGHRVCDAEHRRREGGLDDLAMAVLRAVVAISSCGAALSGEVRRAVACGHQADDVEG